MATYRDCIEIDCAQFMLGEFVALMSDRELGKVIRRMNAAYKAGDFEYVRSLPFVHKVYPPSSPFYRRHIPRSVRREVLSSGTCVTCGTSEKLTIDHITPVSRGGSDDRSNLQPMCLFHNISKGAKTQ